MPWQVKPPSHKETRPAPCCWSYCLAWCPGSVGRRPDSEPLVLSDLVAFGPYDTSRAHRGCYAAFVWIFGEEQVRGFVVAAPWTYAAGSSSDERSGQLITGDSGLGCGHVLASSNSTWEVGQIGHVLLGGWDCVENARHRRTGNVPLTR